MLHEVKLPPAELNALAKLIGQQLDIVAADGWSAEIRTPSEIVAIEPEEVATPDEEHSHGDVERPRIQIVSVSRFGKHLALSEGPFGAIRDIRVLSTLVSFSPTVTCPTEEQLLGVPWPAGTSQYGWVYYRPDERSIALRDVASKQALIDLDIGLELVTEKKPSIVLYTRGYFIHVSLGGLPDEEWVQFGAFWRRKL